MPIMDSLSCWSPLQTHNSRLGRAKLDERRQI